MRGDTAERMRGLYRFRTDRFRPASTRATTERSSRARRTTSLRRELLEAERNAILELRRSGAISNDVWIRVSRDLDLEDQRLDA